MSRSIHPADRMSTPSLGAVVAATRVAEREECARRVEEWAKASVPEHLLGVALQAAAVVRDAP